MEAPESRIFFDLRYRKMFENITSLGSFDLPCYVITFLRFSYCPGPSVIFLSAPVVESDHADVAVFVKTLFVESKILR